MLKKIKPENKAPESQIKEEKRFCCPRFGIKKEKEVFIENLTLLLSSGLSATAAIASIQEEIKSARLKKIIARVNVDIENGFSLWRALEKTEMLDGSIIALIKIGEESGRLTENLKIVSKQSEKNKGFRSKLKSALMYPIFVLGLAVVIAIGIAWFILPRLAKIFSGMNIKLPAITKMMIGIGVFLGDYGLIVVPIAIVVIVILVFFIFFFKKTKFLGQALILTIPGIKKLLIELEITRFSYLMGTLLEAGLPIGHALDSLTLDESNNLNRYQKFYLYLKQSIDEGNSFQKSFTQYKKINSLLPRPIQQMIVAGEQSGKLSEILIKISENYTEKTETTTKNLMVILEPLMLIIVWIAVVFVALSIILPIYSLVGNFNNN